MDQEPIAERRIIAPRHLVAATNQLEENRQIIGGFPERFVSARKGHTGASAPYKRTAGSFVRTLMDYDEVGDVIQDAVVGPLRRGDSNIEGIPGTLVNTSDVAIGAQEVAYNGIMGALGAARASLPTDWTYGHRVAAPVKDRRAATVAGARVGDGGWDLDPAAVGIVAAAISQATSARTSTSKAKESIQGGYKKAHTFFMNIAKSGQALRYDFTIGEPRANTETKQVPIFLSVRYELASRAFDRLWTRLDASRQTSGIDAYRQTVVRMGGEEVAIGMLEDAAYRTKLARTLPMRILLRNRTSGAAEPITNSFFFGTDHAAIEREILETTLQPELRYLMDARNKGSLGNSNPAFGVAIERVMVQGAFDGGDLSNAGMRTPGLRVTIPPANLGYRRGNVVILLRSRYPASAGDGDDDDDDDDDDDEEPDITAQPPSTTLVPKTDIILVAHVPEETLYEHDLPEGRTEWRPISEIPASFVFYNGKQVLAHPHMRTAGEIRQIPLGGERAGPPYRYEWSAMYDLAWLERVSGQDGVVHHVSDQTFWERSEAYFSPSNDRKLDRPWLEVFVEHIPTPERVAELRTRRRQWVFNRALTAYDDPKDQIYQGYFPIPRSHASMRAFSLDRYTKWPTETVYKHSYTPEQQQQQQQQQQHQLQMRQPQYHYEAPATPAPLPQEGGEMVDQAAEAEEESPFTGIAEEDLAYMALIFSDTMSPPTETEEVIEGGEDWFDGLLQGDEDEAMQDADPLADFGVGATEQSGGAFPAGANDSEDDYGETYYDYGREVEHEALETEDEREY